MTTYAYEIDRKAKEKLHRVNFIHMTKSDPNKAIRPIDKYLLSPRLVNFTAETDSIKSVCFKVFKEIRGTLKRAIHS